MKKIIFTRPEVVRLLECKAELFGMDGDEQVYSRTALAFIEERLDESDMAYDGAAPWLENESSLVWTINACKRESVAHEVDGWAEWHADSLRDSFGDDYGDDEGDDRLSDDDVKTLTAKMREVVAWYVSRATVFRCETVETFHLDKDDIRELVEQLRPEWLNKPAEEPSNGESP